MMMISRNKKPLLRPSVLVAISGFIIFFGLVFFWRSSLSSVIWQILSPVVAVRNSLTFQSSEQMAFVSSTTSLLADRDALYKENLDLKSRLGRNAERSVILAAVIQKPPGIPYDTLIIDLGASSGIQKGQLVAAAGSALIGRVADVYATTARVVLFSSPGEEYAALLNATTPISLAGQGGGSLRGEVPVGTPVAVGDHLVIIGIQEAVVGSVSAVEKKDGQSFVVVYARLPANPQELRFVEVWK